MQGKAGMKYILIMNEGWWGMCPRLDDEAPVRELLRIILENAGYHVLEVSNGVEGLQMYRTHATDLVITDLRRPEKNGLETIQELKQEFPDAKIIAMSGQVDPQNDLLMCAQRLGATRTLAKPLNFAQVLATVQDVLQN